MALPDNLAFYYELDDTQADFGGLNLTNNGAATFPAEEGVNLVAASSQYLSAADDPTFDMGDIDFTLVCMAKLASKPGASMAILSKFVTTLNQRSYQLLWQQSTDRFLFQISPDGTSTNAVSVLANNLGSPALDTWYFIACRHDAAANSMRISVNDGTNNTATLNGGSFPSTAPFEIGRTAGTSLWNGRVKRVGGWKRFLSDAEITALYNGGNPLGYEIISGQIVRKAMYHKRIAS